MYRPWKLRPACLTRENSLDSASRAAFGNRYRTTGTSSPPASGEASSGGPSPGGGSGDSDGSGLIRPGCVARSGLRRPSAAAACGRVACAGRGWHAHSWSSCGRETQIAVCAYAWMLDRCVSYKSCGVNSVEKSGKVSRAAGGVKADDHGIIGPGRRRGYSLFGFRLLSVARQKMFPSLSLKSAYDPHACAVGGLTNSTPFATSSSYVFAISAVW